ncbi:hypothetical protein C2U55_24415 [Enterobacteriaceae bacterium ENNIH3]|nr:hypothetical protein C2U55_24415 [Enterobacteriaceae bacterium ENNIH3]AUV07958.1 hypothetical protein C2U52_17690 [Enterobacteriaceae bacterium ENNIH2]
MFLALNAKLIYKFGTNIIIAIIINFIYYRHSILNVCLPLLGPNAWHSVFFFTFLYVNKFNLC